MTRKYTKLPSEDKIRKIWASYHCKCIDKQHIPTKNGFLLEFLISRQTYCKWKKKSDALKEIEGFIENEWVQRLTGNTVAGTIFYLKNAFGYRDRQDIDHTSGGKPIPLFDNTTTKK